MALFGGIGLLLLMGGCAQSSTYVALGTVNIEREMPTAINRMQVQTGVGDVIIIGGAEEKISVVADVRVKSGRSGVAIGEAGEHVDVTTEGGVIRICDAHLNQIDHNDWQVKLTVHAPSRLAVEADASVGNIRVEGMTADLDICSGVGDLAAAYERIAAMKAKTDVGSITLRGGSVTGPITAVAEVGDVHLEIAKTAPIQAVKLQSNVGDIMVQLPPGVMGRFQALTGVGSVSLPERPGQIVSKTVTGCRVEALAGSEGPIYDLSTGVGDVTVR